MEVKGEGRRVEGKGERRGVMDAMQLHAYALFIFISYVYLID